MNNAQESDGAARREPGVLKRFVRWPFCWRVMRRWLFMLACLATLTGLFYAVENWRGRRAWEKCRRELEAKGEVLDWNAYIPAPVPDDQNLFKAPMMKEWFVRGPFLDSFANNPVKASKAQASLTPPQGREPATGPVLVAEVKVVLPAAPPGPEQADAVLRFDDPAAREQAEKLLDTAIGPWAEGAQACLIVARPRDQVKPVHLVLQADTVPTLKTLGEFFPRSSAPQLLYWPRSLSYLQIGSVGSNTFQLSLKSRVYTASDYLAWTQPQEADFDLMRKGLERPQVRMDGDYERPFARPVPNFVMCRTVAQRLSQRAQCYLLLGQPEAAWHELALVRDLCRLLEGSPPRKATTLVEAMIDVAITGLYTSIIEDGLRLQAWREPELAAIQKQLKGVNLLPLVQEAMNAERAGVCRTFEITPPAEWFSYGKERLGLWGRLKHPGSLVIDLMPRGWIYQNMSAVAFGHQLTIELFDVPSNQVLPRRAEGISNQIHTALSRRTPYTFLASIATPNFVRASQTMARNQTLANEAFIACGLERYRLAHGQYPETLEALVPQFAEKLPHDIIGGQPLKYHRTPDGRFVLYSVGWNEKDDGGVTGKTGVEGDWVWP